MIEGQKFDLSQSSFVIFIFSYAPPMIVGSIIFYYLFDMPIPKWLFMLLYALYLLGVLVKAILDLQYNKTTLVISDSAIAIYLKKRKNNILLAHVNKDEVKSITQLQDEAFIVTKNDDSQVQIDLSCKLKPYKMLLYSVKAALYKIYGEEKTDFKEDKFLTEYISTNKLPEKLLNDDKTKKMNKVTGIILGIVFAALPTALALLALCYIALVILEGLLSGLLKIIS